MTRAELSEFTTPLIDALQDHAMGAKRITAFRAEEMAEQIAEIAERLMEEGLIG